jgi:hypothetical protein
MQINPASFDQIRMAWDGNVVTIPAEYGGVAADIARLDPCLKLRYSKSSECFIVFRVHRHGEVCREDDPERTEELVLSAVECDDRIVKRLEYIDPQGRGGYDYVAEIEKATLEAHKQRRAGFAEQVGETAEQVAHALRKDLGERYRGGIVVPRDVV